MKFFLDTFSLQEVQEVNDSYIIDGVYLNHLFLKKNKNNQNIIKDISENLEGPIIIPVNFESPSEIIKEATSLKRISENICIQLPINFDNLKLCRNLVDDGFFVNMTLCFSVSQAILAAKMGANFVTISIAKCDKVGLNKIALISDIRKVLDNYPEFQVEIIINDFEDPLILYDCGKIGVDVCSVSLKTLKNLSFNSLTQQEERILKEEMNKILDTKNNSLY